MAGGVAGRPANRLMRNWLSEARAHQPSAETAEIAKTPPAGTRQVVSAVSAVSATTLPCPVADGQSGDSEVSHQTDTGERAAIIEHGGQMPRRWAEGLARLHPDRPPRGFTPIRWLEVVNDSGLLLDRWGATLEALGWIDADVWGCDASAPDQRLDLAGLALAMSGREVVAVTSSTATIRTASGTLTFYRRPKEEPRTLLWEMPT